MPWTMVQRYGGTTLAQRWLNCARYSARLVEGDAGIGGHVDDDPLARWVGGLQLAALWQFAGLSAKTPRMDANVPPVIRSKDAARAPLAALLVWPEALSLQWPLLHDMDTVGVEDALTCSTAPDLSRLIRKKHRRVLAGAFQRLEQQLADLGPALRADRERSRIMLAGCQWVHQMDEQWLAELLQQDDVLLRMQSTVPRLARATAKFSRAAADGGVTPRKMTRLRTRCIRDGVRLIVVMELAASVLSDRDRQWLGDLRYLVTVLLHWQAGIQLFELFHSLSGESAEQSAALRGLWRRYQRNIAEPAMVAVARIWEVKPVQWQRRMRRLLRRAGFVAFSATA